MINPNDPANPAITEEDFDIPDSHMTIRRKISHPGLTIRAELASGAMRSLLSKSNYWENPAKCAEEAVKYADALIAELNKDRE